MMENFYFGMKILLFILAIVAGLDLTINTSSLIIAYTDLIKEKKSVVKYKKYKYINIGDKIAFGNDLLNTISLLADIEVSSKLQSLKLLNTQYDIRNLDTDIEEICSKIFDGLINSAFDDTTLFTDDFIIHEIYEIVSMTFMEKMNELNKTIMQSNRIK